METIALFSCVAGIASALFILGDAVAGHRQKMAIMNAVFPLTGLYLGPLGALAYWALGRRASVAGHERGERGPGAPPEAFWQSVLVSTSHCGAGCTLRDFIGEWRVLWLGIAVAERSATPGPAPAPFRPRSARRPRA